MAAYDRIATEFSRISEDRRAYLDRIEQLVVSRIPPGARSLLDVGAGDGSRSFRMIQAAGIQEFVLLEPSAEMRGFWPPGTPGWPIRAEELSTQESAFDVITCLWNVLGHIFPAGTRAEVLRQCARLLTPRGLIFCDVNHRYNAAQYGYAATLARFLRDRILPDVRNGDVISRWEVNGEGCSTKGHVFTDREFQRLASAAGLTVRQVLAVNYRTGEVCNRKSSGSLFYVLERSA